MRNWIKAVIAALIVCLCVAGVELIAQRGALGLPEAQRLVEVTPEMLSGAESAEDSLALLEGEGSFTVRYEGYVGSLRLEGELYGESPYSVRVTWADGSASSVKADFRGDADVTAVGGDVKSIKIALPDGGEITGITLDNRFGINPFRAVLTGLLALGACLLVLLRRVVARRAEVGFLIVCLCVGIALVAVLPANTGLSFDDAIHYGRVLLLSGLRHGEVSAAPAEPANGDWSVVRGENFVHPCDTWQDEVAFNREIDAAYDAGSLTELSGTVQWAFSDIGYVTQAAGLGIARLFGLPFHLQLKAARLFNLLTYAALCWAAIRALRRFRLVFAGVALMPTSLFLACNFSYDPTISGCCFLGLALALDAVLDRHTPLSWQRALGILLFLTLGGLPKVVYLPLLLTVLLLPRSKFATTAQRLWYKGMAVALLLAGIGSMALSVNQGMVTLSDSRGAGVEASDQIRWILQHPFTYLGIFLRTMWEEGEQYLLQHSRLTLAYLGGVGAPVSTLSLYLLLFTAFTANDPDEGQRMDWKKRLALLVIAGLTVGLVFTTMYTAFCDIGALHYSGVQGRYLIPVLPLVLCLLSPEGVRNRMNRTGWHLTFFGLQLLMLGYVAAACVLPACAL